MTIILPTDDQKAMNVFVDRRHPAYARFIAHWMFCESTYDGGREWFTHNIHAYLKEGTKEYSDRLNRAYRFNHTREIVQLVTKYIFKEGVIRNSDDAPDALVRFWKHATLDGAPVDSLMKQICNLSSTNGRVWVAVDNRTPQGAVLTKADEKKSSFRTYAYLIKQSDVLDFSRDDMGVLNWILYRFKHREDTDPVTSNGELRTRYMLWTKEEYIILEAQRRNDATPVITPIVRSLNGSVGLALDETYENQIDVIERGENTIGLVPVFQSDNVENSEPYAPPSLIDEIAYLDRAVANYLSNLDAIIQDQTFSQLVMPAQGLMPGEEDYKKMLEMGTKRIFLYDGETAGAAPQYISPDAAQAGLIIAIIKTIIGEIYHSVGMAGERTKQDNAMGIDNSSGVAKAYDFERMNALLASKADMLQRTEEKIAFLVQLWGGIDPDELETDEKLDQLIKYPDTYDVRGLPDELEIATQLTVLEAPPQLRRHQMDIIIDKLFPRLASDVAAAIKTDLESWPPDPLEQAQAMANIQTTAKGNAIGSLDLKSGSSPKPQPKPPAKTASKNKQGQNNKD